MIKENPCLQFSRMLSENINDIELFMEKCLLQVKDEGLLLAFSKRNSLDALKTFREIFNYLAQTENLS